MDTSPLLVFIHKDSPDGYRWVAQHDNIILYLYMKNPIILIKYYQEFEKKTTIECITIYDALDKIYDFTKRTAVFKSNAEPPANYMS